MFRSDDKTLKSFGSLGADDRGFQAATTAAAREAEHRWPLFKSVVPTKSDAPPALSEQERQLWSRAEKSEARVAAPALSLPGMGDKLAASLARMGRPLPVEGLEPSTVRENPLAARGTSAASSAAPVPVEAQQPHADAARSTIAAAPAAPAAPAASETSRALFAKPVVSAPAPPEPPAGRGLFAKKNAVPPAPEPAITETVPAPPVSADDSLTSIFGRLEGREEPASKSTDKRGSLFGRLGR